MNPYGFSEDPYQFTFSFDSKLTEESIGTHHIWMNGPDGHSYHCPLCGISKCNDHDRYRTCEEWIIHQAEVITRNQKYPYFDVSRRLWIQYLKRRTHESLQKD